jgi:hypothetical protein
VRIGELIDAAGTEVVILERVAFGAGQTNWFVCRDSGEYGSVFAGLLPGSSVSVYFDGRIARSRYGDPVRAAILRIAAAEHDCVVGVLGAEPGRLEVEFIESAGELDEFEQTLGDCSEVYFGSFPGRDNDGVKAVTFTVPDEDGQVRAHPH